MNIRVAGSVIGMFLCASLCGCSAPPDIAGVAQNTPYSHSVNAVYYLDAPKPWTTGAVPGTQPPTVPPPSDFRKLFHKSELIDRLGREQGAIRELLAMAARQNPELKDVRLSALREALKCPKRPMLSGVPKSTLADLGIAAATMDHVVQFALGLTIPDPTLAEINEAYSRELVAHNDPLAIIVNGVRLPSDGEGKRDIAVVLQIESSTEIGRKDIVVSYQREMVTGDPLNFADQLVYFDPAWDAVNPVEFRIQLLDVSAERNERTQQLLTQADGLMSSISGLVPHPAIPGITVAMEAAKLILGNRENKVLLDYRVQFFGRDVVTGSNDADVGLLRRGSWVVIGKPTEASPSYLARPMYKQRVTGEIYAGPLDANTGKGGRGLGVPCVEVTVSTADVQVPKSVMDRSDQLLKIIATRGKNDPDALSSALHALSSSIEAYGAERRLKKHRVMSELDNLIMLVWRAQPGTGMSKDGQIASEQLLAMHRTIELVLGSDFYLAAIKYGNQPDATQIDNLKDWWTDIGKTGSLVPDEKASLGFKWKPPELKPPTDKPTADKSPVDKPIEPATPPPPSPAPLKQETPK